ncbi:hypothetical protein MK280_15195, partial [Myxococcota bacterium]|nr:hypothetical protein [Myxococcota bacterium]
KKTVHNRIAVVTSRAIRSLSRDSSGVIEWGRAAIDRTRKGIISSDCLGSWLLVPSIIGNIYF